MTTQSSYNEETIVSLLNELYSLYISLAYLQPSQIIRPDPTTGRHNINQALCKSLGIDPAVISLMEKIPYIDGPYANPQTREGLDEDASAYGCFLFPGSRAYSFLRDQDIIESRDPQCDGVEPLRPSYLLSHDIALAHNLRDGMTLVLDTKANTVRMLDSADGPDYVNPEGTVLERPEDPMYYRNYYTQHAPSYLQDLIKKIRSLEIIPIAGASFRWRDFMLDVNDCERQRVKKILTEQFGWPNNFRQEAWKDEGEEIWNHVFQLNLDDNQ